jgi:phosphoenolpyruvate carboxylase
MTIYSEIVNILQAGEKVQPKVKKESQNYSEFPKDTCCGKEEFFLTFPIPNPKGEHLNYTHI